MLVNKPISFAHNAYDTVPVRPISHENPTSSTLARPTTTIRPISDPTKPTLIADNNAHPSSPLLPIITSLYLCLGHIELVPEYDLSRLIHG